MITTEAIEAYLLETGREYTAPEKNMWIVNDDEHVENIVIYYAPPLITFRVKLMDMPRNDRRSELCERLLRLNAGEMVAGAYGIEDDSIVIVDTLQVENLDLNELQASIDGLSLAASMHYDDLGQYRDATAEATADDAALAAFDAQLEQA